MGISDLERDPLQIAIKCRKKQFRKELLSVEEIEKSIANTIKLIHSVNPNGTIILRFRRCDTSKMVLSKTNGVKPI
jgi:hypothetical protein